MERRKLGYIEAICAATCDSGFNTSTIISTCELNGALDEETMVHALEVMFNKHPMLHSVIRVEDGDWFLEPSAQFEDLSVEFMSYKKGVEKVVDKEMTNMFDISKSLWRIAILVDDRKRKEKNHTLVLTTHHAIVDGSSAVVFFNDLMKMYEKLEDNPDYRAEELPFLDNIEELLDTRKLLDEYLAEKKHILDFEFDHLPYEKVVPMDKRVTRAKYLDFPKEELDKIVRSAKEHGVSVNAFLNGAMLLAYADYWKKKIKTPTITPISLREKAIPKIGYEHLGMFVSFIQLNFTVDSKMDIYELAKEYKEEFDREIEMQAFKPSVAKMKSIDLFEKLTDFQPSEGEEFPAGICLTNLTRYPLNPNLKRHKLKSIHFSTVRNAGDIPFLLHMMTMSDTLYTSMTWCNPAVSDEQGEHFCKLFVERLEKACGFKHEW